MGTPKFVGGALCFRSTETLKFGHRDSKKDVSPVRKKTLYIKFIPTKFAESTQNPKKKLLEHQINQSDRKSSYVYESMFSTLKV
jgi:hypothetical protein